METFMWLLYPNFHFCLEKNSLQNWQKGWKKLKEFLRSLLRTAFSTPVNGIRFLIFSTLSRGFSWRVKQDRLLRWFLQFWFVFIRLELTGSIVWKMIGHNLVASRLLDDLHIYVVVQFFLNWTPLYYPPLLSNYGACFLAALNNRQMSVRQCKKMALCYRKWGYWNWVSSHSNASSNFMPESVPRDYWQKIQGFFQSSLQCNNWNFPKTSK